MNILIPPGLTRETVRPPPSGQRLELTGETMGTTWSLRGHGPQELALSRVRSALEESFAEIIAELSTWEPASFISRFNRAVAGEMLTPPMHFQTVWQAAVEIADATGGAFNPCLGGQVRARGFGPPGHTAGTLPHVWRGDPVTQPDGQIRQPGALELDLSAIAKGYAVDLMAKTAEALGLTTCLVEIGGEFVGQGVHPDGTPWWVEIERPSQASPRWRVALCGLALATSGDLHRCVGDISHIVTAPAEPDPALACVSVLAASCMRADAWATALFAAGRSGPALARAHGIAALFQARDGTAHISPALQRFLDEA